LSKLELLRENFISLKCLWGKRDNAEGRGGVKVEELNTKNKEEEEKEKERG
jgi:hypothetical protein